ncbi:MAG: hypothetical protein M3279_02680 [Actinomycetota bacterium]|nr:hypothetical protein [Actinomycetota bacterium]
MTISSLRKTSVAVAAVLLLLVGACSDPQGTEPEDLAATAGGAATPQAEASGDGGTASGKRGSDDGGRGTGGSSAGGGPGGGGGTRGSGGGGGNGFAAGPRGSAGYPAAGDYVYAQDGWERFCQGPSCNKEPLPETATTSASYSQRSADAAVVVTETRSSEKQKLTTTTRYTREKALITKVVIDFTYSGLDFAQSYEPQPPIEALLFPLSAQDGWRGRWKARTSGDYRVRILGRDAVSIGGRSVSAYRLETVTNFRGDFSGRAQMSVWIDPETAMVLKTDSDVAVVSNFGEYTSSFETTLRSGPGY